MPSLRSRLIEGWLRVTGAKHLTNMIDLVYPLDAKHAAPPSGMKRRLRVSDRVEFGSKVYTVAPRAPAAAAHVYYLHGGAYYNGFLGPHWNFLDDAVTQTNCTVTAPDFPLAPHATVDDIFAVVFPLYEMLVAQYGADNITVIGDSSGGGMALVLAQKARAAGVPVPKDLVLLSPWLDVTMTNPDIPEANRKDPALGLHACVSAGARYAQSLDPKRPDISPIYGPLDGLGRTTLFVGTHDIMLPDCRKLKGLAERAGVAYAHREYEAMIHDWMLLTLPESRTARAEIFGIIQRPA